MENDTQTNTGQSHHSNNNQMVIAGAVLIAGLLIAGAILIKGNTTSTAGVQTGGNAPITATVTPVSASDRTQGDPKAKVTIIEYADFQCPFCGRFYSDTGKTIMDKYVATGKVQFVYRDYAFLGPESIRSAEAARCAQDQGKFWEYHDYLFTHQKGENQGNFSDPNLKIFAKTLGLDTASFNTCLDSGKYAQAIADATTEGSKDGVQGTPKGFILKNGKVVGLIDGAEPSTMVIPKIEAALK